MAGLGNPENLRMVLSVSGTDFMAGSLSATPFGQESLNNELIFRPSMLPLDHALHDGVIPHRLISVRTESK